MAVWQWTISMLPKNRVSAHFSTIPHYLVEDWFYSLHWGNLIHLDKLEAFFDNILPRAYNIEQKNVLVWGINNEDEIYIVIEDQIISEVSLRFDTRFVNMTLIDSILDFAKQNDFVFWSLEDNTFIEPESTTFLKRLNDSKAMLFVKAPEDFFRNKGYLDNIRELNSDKMK